MLYFIKRKIEQIKNIIRWIPVLWNTFDWDYSYSLKVFKFQLENQAKYFESDKCQILNGKDQASRIRLILKLMDKVYQDYYMTEEYGKIKGIYGEEMFKWIFTKVNDKTGASTLNYQYELIEDKKLSEEIDKAVKLAFKVGYEKHCKAERILWKLVEHNLTSFWC